MDQQFTVGDQVLLKLQPYAQHSVANRPFPKLAFKYFGPYRVLERIGNATYKLELPDNSLIHPIFHISQLKPFTADYSPVFFDLSNLVDLGAHDLAPELILARRLVKKGNQAISQVQVKWNKLLASSATWEYWNVVTQRFPGAAAWGQVASWGG